MTTRPTLRLFLEPGLRRSAEAGAHNFISKIVDIAEIARFRVEFHDHRDALKNDPGTYSLSHMKPPLGARALVFRRVYQYPFWQIDRTHERWHWEIAQARFDPDVVDPAQAQRFYRFWQERLYQDAPKDTSREGFVYLPLQGRLSEHRSFQRCSPLDMVAHCLAHDPTRRIIATLHPREEYGPTELAALERLEKRHARLELRMGDMVPLLQRCDYVVTQNSSAAFAGYFFGKPALLFGKIDFHHIAVNAEMADLPSCFEAVADHAPDYGTYLWWFWQHRSINAGRPEAGRKIAERLRHFGWPIE